MRGPPLRAPCCCGEGHGRVVGLPPRSGYGPVVALLPVPQPYDFFRSTDRFRVYGPDRATVWQDGGLHRVIDGREVRIEAADGGVRVEPCEPGIERHVAFLLGLPLDLAAF